MSRWLSAMESQPVALTVMVGPTQNPSNHQARQWQDLNCVESILGPTLIESRAHTLLSIKLYIPTPQCSQMEFFWPTRAQCFGDMEEGGFWPSQP